MSYAKQILWGRQDPFMYSGSSFDKQHFSASCQLDDVIPGASHDLDKDNVSAEDSETNGGEPEDDPVSLI